MQKPSLILFSLLIFLSFTTLSVCNEKVISGKAKVVSVGNLVEGIHIDDIVYYDKHAGHGIQHKDKFYGVIKQQDVVLID